MKAPRRGFTLIELLVVIAIISILASILFPVFARARAKGRQTACLSNVRQLVMAFIMYANDADETMPYGGPTPEPPPGALTVPLWTDSIFAYTHNDQILFCPDRKDATHGYGVNFLASGKAEGSFFDPASKILLGDVNPEFLGVRTPGQKPVIWWINDVGNQWCLAPDPGVPPLKAYTSFTGNNFPQRHNDGVIYGYVDGHAKWGREEQMAQQVFWNPSTRTR